MFVNSYSYVNIQVTHSGLKRHFAGNRYLGSRYTYIMYYWPIDYRQLGIDWPYLKNCMASFYQIMASSIITLICFLMFV